MTASTTAVAPDCHDDNSEGWGLRQRVLSPNILFSSTVMMMTNGARDTSYRALVLSFFPPQQRQRKTGLEMYMSQAPGAFFSLFLLLY